MSDPVTYVKDMMLARWVGDLGLEVVEPRDGGIALRLPFSPRLVQGGGVVCGQALMAVADTGMVLGITHVLGELRPMTTVSQNTTFLRPAVDCAIELEVDIQRKGRRLVFGEVKLYDPERKLIAHATSTYALLPKKDN